MLFIIHFYLRTLNVESACGGSKREKSNKKCKKKLDRREQAKKKEKRGKYRYKGKKKRKRFFVFLSSHVFVLSQ